MSALQYRLLVHPHFIFLSPMNNMRCSVCCTATWWDCSKSVLPEEEVLGVFQFFSETEGVCANCVAGKQHHDCLSVSPDVETLSWLSVPGPSLVSLCVS